MSSFLKWKPNWGRAGTKITPLNSGLHASSYTWQPWPGNSQRPYWILCLLLQSSKMQNGVSGWHVVPLRLSVSQASSCHQQQKMVSDQLGSECKMLHWKGQGSRAMYLLWITETPNSQRPRRSKPGDRHRPPAQQQTSVKHMRADGPATGQCCYDYNVGRCNRQFCKFQHTCLKCHSQHPLVECASQARPTSQDASTKVAKTG